jgi:serine acetyltransferase
MLQRIIQSVSYRYRTSNSDRFVDYLIKKGCLIGEGTVFHQPRTNLIDVTRPYLLSIGKNVDITAGVVVLTHGADWHVLREVFHVPLGSAGEVRIEDNVFIGINSIITKGVTIHSNSIIGAGSVVTRNIPGNCVVAGNPAKPIMGIEEYYKKCTKRAIDEACLCAQALYKRYNRLPVPDDFKEYFYLFLQRDPDRFGSIPVRMQTGSAYQEFMASKPVFSSFDEFLSVAGLSQPVCASENEPH